MLLGNHFQNDSTLHDIIMTGLTGEKPDMSTPFRLLTQNSKTYLYKGSTHETDCCYQTCLF